MRKILLYVCLCLSGAVFANSQDTVVLDGMANTAVIQSPIQRNGGKFYAGNQLLSQREYQNLLQNTCPAAFQQYDSGRKLTIAGWCVFGTGAAVSAFGGGLLISGLVTAANNDPTATPAEGLGKGIGAVLTSAVGIICLIPGGVLLTTSVPLLCVGYSKRNKSVDTYNQSLNAPPISYHITTGQDGIGLAIRF